MWIASLLAAIMLAFANGANDNFKGVVVADAIAAAPEFSASVGLGAAATVLLATYLGLPISTTHALTGALVGAGLIHAANEVAFSHLGTAFFAPLLFSPLLAMIGAAAIYLVFRACRLALGVDKESCLCVGREILHSELLPAAGERLFKPLPVLQPQMGSNQQCQQSYVGDFWGFPIFKALDKLHYLSAGAVGFARGLNDTPKSPLSW
jgi:PiT family inorganic phosphate transporter